jgi:hypothetical protein
MIQVQQDALAVRSEIWQLSPEVRPGRLFAHLGFLGEVHVGRGFGYIRRAIRGVPWTGPRSKTRSARQPMAPAGSR